jgi:hypothetical protein
MLYPDTKTEFELLKELLDKCRINYNDGCYYDNDSQEIVGYWIEFYPTIADFDLNGKPDD